MNLKKKFIPKAAGSLLISATLLTGGCASMDQRDLYMGAGAGIGGAITGALTDGKSNNTQGVAILGGAAAGALIGSMLAPDCENRTTTDLNRNIYGNTETQWQGQQRYTEECRGSGDQNRPAANLPRSVQTQGFTFEK